MRGGKASEFKTIGAGNHTDADRQHTHGLYVNGLID